jgi:hypothetical protein
MVLTDDSVDDIDLLLHIVDKGCLSDDDLRELIGNDFNDYLNGTKNVLSHEQAKKINDKIGIDMLVGIDVD